MGANILSVLLGNGKIDIAALPVSKITFYPLETRSYKPYSQIAIGKNDVEIAFRLIAFEVDPNPSSQIGAMLSIFESQPHHALEAWCTPEGADVFLSSIDSDQHKLAFESKKIVGEDLQGVFWGYDIRVSIEKFPFNCDLNLNQKIFGNCFKIDEKGKTHFGSLGVTDFEKFKLLGRDILRENLVEFKVI